MKILENFWKYWDTIGIFNSFNFEPERNISAKAWKMTGDAMKYTINDVAERFELNTRK